MIKAYVSRASLFLSVLLLHFFPGSASSAQAQTVAPHAIVLHAAGLLDVKNGRIVKPGEILVQGERIVEMGSAVKHPAGAEVFDLGDRILLPGLIDAHVHLFLHPGAEDLQTVQESVPQRTIQALLAARDDLMAGFTAERDMGTEGAGSADTAVRNAIEGWLRGRDCGSAGMRSTSWAGMRMRSSSTLRSMCCLMLITLIIKMS